MSRPQEALYAIEEAANLYRDLAEARPDEFAPHLAGSVNTVSLRMSDVGRNEEAVTAMEVAVSLRRKLAAARPSEFTPDLAESLTHLASLRSFQGRLDDALAGADDDTRDALAGWR